MRHASTSLRKLTSRRRLDRLKARPRLEALEDRVLLDGNDPLNLLRFGDAYLDNWVGPDATTYLPAQASGPAVLPAAFAAQLLTGIPAGTFGPLGPAGPGTDVDPGALGPLAVTREEYDFGNLPYQPPAFPTAGGPLPVELIASVHAPTDLSGGPRPLIVLLHGRHNTTYNPTTGATSFVWPPNTGGGFVSIPSYQGYDYLSEVLASHGYIVVSTSANGINARDAGSADAGMAARGNLVQRHLRIWEDLNSGDGTVQTRPGDTAAFTPAAPFGNRFVGKVDLQNVGTMGHSRGGEGVVRHFIINQQQGAPFGIRAVFPLAPVDFQRPIINNVPLGVLLPTHDGDVSDLQGVHFYDDARYNVAGDTAPKHTFEVNGANHNFYNTIWTPGLFPPAGTPGTGATSDDGVNAGGAVNRLPATQVRGTGLAAMAAFFRTYVGNATVPVQTVFVPFLKGDVPAPPSAQVGDDKLRVSYHAPDLASFRRDLNRLSSANSSDLTTNTLGGSVSQSGLTPYLLCGGAVPQPQHCLPGATARQPHTTGARPAAGNLSQLHLGWSNTTEASWENQLPAGSRDVSGFYALQFRTAINWNDLRNIPIVPQDFSVVLTDGAGRSARTLVSDSARSLFYPTPGNVNLLPKLFHNTVRIPLRTFAAGNVDLTDVRSVRFEFDRSPNGALMITDLAFADPATAYAGPFVTFASPFAVAADSIAGPLPSQVAGPLSSIRVTFNVPINPTSFSTSDIISLTGPGGSIAVTSVAVVPGKANRQFDVFFPTQTQGGTYTLVLGPNINDAVGNAMDQNFNRTLGEATGDRATLTFRISGAASAAEIQVLDGAADIADGAGSVDFGATPAGTAVTRTFTVRNLAPATTPLASGTLVLSPQVTLPAGFTLVSFSQNTIVPGGSATFTVRLDATSPGTFSGTLSFDNNDVNENPFDFTIAGVVGGATLRVAELTATPSGFVARFNRALNPATLNLYDTQDGGLGAAAATLVGATVGAVRGSLVVSSDNTTVTFVATGGVLLADTYTVTLRSTATGFVDAGGAPLDGDGDGSAGDAFTTTFGAAPQSVVVSVPDFARGPGQAVGVPATVAGLPLRLTNAAGITAVSLILRYNPALLSITGGTVAPGLPAGAAVQVDASTPGAAVITFTSPALPGTVSDFVHLTAAVPLSIASAYTSKQVLAITDLVVNDGLVSATADAGVQVISYFGDTNASGTYSALDAQRALRVAVGLDSGFLTYQLADPLITADITGNGSLNALDATRILQEALGIDQVEIPLLPPGPPAVTLLGPDPVLSLPRRFRARPGGLVTVPVNLDVSEGLDSADLAIAYDTSRLEVVSVRRGQLTRDFDLFAFNVDAEAGTVAAGLGRTSGAISGRGPGSVLRITFRVRDDAPAGKAVINLLAGMNALRTQLNENVFDLNPDPSDEAGDALDGAIRVIATDVAGLLAKLRRRLG